VLLAVEIIERADARDKGERHIAEHGHECGIPEEDVLIERGIDKLGNKSGSRSRLLEIRKGNFPGFPVRSHPL
jgi:hypothetical protein